MIKKEDGKKPGRTFLLSDEVNKCGRKNKKLHTPMCTKSAVFFLDIIVIFHKGKIIPPTL